MTTLKKVLERFGKKFPYEEIMEVVGEGEDGGIVPIGTKFLEEVEPHFIVQFIAEEFTKAMDDVVESCNQHICFGINLEKYLICFDCLTETVARKNKFIGRG